MPYYMPRQVHRDRVNLVAREDRQTLRHDSQVDRRHTHQVPSRPRVARFIKPRHESLFRPLHHFRQRFGPDRVPLAPRLAQRPYSHCPVVTRRTPSLLPPLHGVLLQKLQGFFNRLLRLPRRSRQLGGVSFSVVSFLEFLRASLRCATKPDAKHCHREHADRASVHHACPFSESSIGESSKLVLAG